MKTSTVSIEWGLFMAFPHDDGSSQGAYKLPHRHSPNDRPSPQGSSKAIRMKMETHAGDVHFRLVSSECLSAHQAYSRSTTSDECDPSREVEELVCA